MKPTPITRAAIIIAAGLITLAAAIVYQAQTRHPYDYVAVPTEHLTLVIRIHRPTQTLEAHLVPDLGAGWRGIDMAKASDR